jgi:mRNA (guanine-N7-)-methyltransferase
MINNSNLRKKLSTLKPVAPSVCIRAIAELGPAGQHVEREVRFGSYSPDGRRFTPGVTERQIQAVKELLSGWRSERIVDTVTSRSQGKTQNIRRIESANGSTIYQLKEKQAVIDVPSEGFRLARSMERTFAPLKDIFEQLPSRGEYKQTRDRMSYFKGSIRVDITKVRNNVYHLEIEFGQDIQVACRYTTLIKETLQKVVVSGYVFAEYKNLVGSTRFAGPLPQTLTLEAFRKKVLTKNDYSVTEKADGDRVLMFIDSQGNFNTVTRKMEIKQVETINSKPDWAGTILDGELSASGIFYGFDILFAMGTDMRSKLLKDRLIILDDVTTRIKDRKIKMKTFYCEVDEKIFKFPGNTESSFRNIYDAAGHIWSKRKSFPYDLDGLIFTPMKEPYSNRNIFKWKDENTIDFYYDESQLFLAGNLANGTYGHLPFSGLDGKGTFKIKGRNVENKIFTSEMIPQYLRRGFLPEEIKGPPGVGEFLFAGNTFKLIRKRPDKEFANGVEASNQSWEAVVNPVSAEMIGNGPGALRDFHSEIKAKLIMKYARGKSVLDIGSGKGEDVGKYLKAGSKPVVGFDLVKEEYPHPDYMSFYQVPNSIYSVKNIMGKEEKFDVININFAIHYFLENKKLFESLLLNINNASKKGTVLMATVLDGAKLFGALKKNGKISSSVADIEKKYNNKDITFESPKFKFLGQKVDVMVKGTKYFAGRSITEFLFNFDKFLQIMEKLGFELIETKSFSDLCSDSPWCRRYMSANEKDYSFKNIYFVLKRVK